MRARLIRATACLAWVAAVGPLAAGDARVYERDVETARQLFELETKLADVSALAELDSIDAFISQSRCHEELAQYERARPGDRLDPDDAWTEFETCYSRQLPSFSRQLPAELGTRPTYYDVVQFYDEKLAEYPDLVEGHAAAAIHPIEQEIERLEAQPPFIGTVTSVFRKVEIEGRGPRRDLRKGDHVFLRDIIYTGPRGRVRIDLADRIEEKDAGPTVVNIGSNSEVQMMKFEPRLQRGYEEDWSLFSLTGVVDVIRGSIRAFTKGFAGEAAFSVRCGTSVCGIRGTNVEIDYEPELDKITYRLYEGVVEITTPTRRITLEPGQTLIVKDGVPMIAPPA